MERIVVPRRALVCVPVWPAHVCVCVHVVRCVPVRVHTCVYVHVPCCVCRVHVDTLLNSRSWTLDTHLPEGAELRSECLWRGAGGGRHVLAERGPLFLPPCLEPGLGLSSLPQPRGARGL